PMSRRRWRGGVSVRMPLRRSGRMGPRAAGYIGVGRPPVRLARIRVQALNAFRHHRQGHRPTPTPDYSSRSMELQPLVLINAVGLTERLLAHAPRLKPLADSGWVRSLE